LNVSDVDIPWRPVDAKDTVEATDARPPGTTKDAVEGVAAVGIPVGDTKGIDAMALAVIAWLLPVGATASKDVADEFLESPLRVLKLADAFIDMVVPATVRHSTTGDSGATCVVGIGLGDVAVVIGFAGMESERSSACNTFTAFLSSACNPLATSPKAATSAFVSTFTSTASAMLGDAAAIVPVGEDTSLLAVRLREPLMDKLPLAGLGVDCSVLVRLGMLL